MFSRFKNYVKTSRDLHEVLLLLPIFSLYGIINKYIFTFVETEGPSMQPTITESSIALVDRLFYKTQGLQRGDIVVAISPLDPSTQICKRVLYLPGDIKTIDNGFISENMTIPTNHVWIEGDNKGNSFDSRNHGPIPMQLIQGKVIRCVFPFKSLY
jgi:mitochondrial inner membrane protease subunit 1